MYKFRQIIASLPIITLILVVPHLSLFGAAALPTSEPRIEAPYPPVPYLGDIMGVSYTSDNKMIYEMYQPKSNIWYVKVPRDLVNSTMISNPSYASLTINVFFISIKADFKYYLYTRDVLYDYYCLEQIK